MGITGIDKHEQLRTLPTPEALWSGAGAAQGTSGSATILSVYSSETSARALRGTLTGFRHELIQADTTEQALAALTRHRIDLVLLDLATPEPGALDFCRFVKKSPTTQFLPVYVLGTCDDDPEEEVRAIEAGADEFLVRPLRPRAFRARVQASLRHRALVDSIDDSEAVLFSLAQSVEERDPDLGLHCQRLALMGAAMGLTLGLPSSDILALQRGGYLHDIGKVAVPDNVLFKPGPLTPQEWDTMKTHPERGERICKGVKSLASVLPIIRHHHEKWDGSGYPDGLQGDQIPLLARILQMADIYDALTSERPYKQPMTPEQALGIIREEARKGWRDPQLVDMFAEILPMFRTVQPTGDSCHMSLRALARSIDQYRADSVRSSKNIDQADLFRKYKLVSGF